MRQVGRLLAAFLFLPLLAAVLVLLVGGSAWILRAAAATFPDETATMLSNLDAVPTVVWAALAASGLTLSGVFLSDIGQTDRLVLQLDHDASSSERERIAVLRREVYLQTAGELTLARNWLGSLPAKDLARVNAAEGLQGFFVAATKLQLVAEPKTAALVSELVTLYGELFLRLMIDVDPIQQLRIERDVYVDFYNRERTDTVRILAEIGRIQELGRVDEAMLNGLNASLEFHEARAQHFEAERKRVAALMNPLHIAFTRRIFEELKVLGRRQVPVMSAIRRDLGLSGDLAAYEAQLEVNAQRTGEKLDEMLAHLERG